MLESTAKEYPAGHIADDWRAQAAAPDFKHIGPIDPDAFTLNQFLKLLVIRAIADVLVDGREVQVKILRTAALNAPAGPQAPDSRAGDQERDAGSPNPNPSATAHAQAECAGG